MIILVDYHDQRHALFLAHASTEETGFSIRLTFDSFCTFCLYDFDFMFLSRNSIFSNENSLKGVLKEEKKKKWGEKYDKSSWNWNFIKKWKIVDDFVRTYVIKAIQMNRMISSACESNSQKPTVPKQSSIQSFLYHWNTPLGLY